MIAADVGWRMRLEIGAGYAGANANETEGEVVAGGGTGVAWIESGSRRLCRPSTMDCKGSVAAVAG
jgi:hypothetical protein